jgi:hypothetical protein
LYVGWGARGQFRPVRIALDNGGKRVGERVACERRTAGEHLVEHAWWQDSALPIPFSSPAPTQTATTSPGSACRKLPVPLATYTGWALRATAFAEGDLCDAAGQKIDFRRTKAERLASGDPRLSVEVRYPTQTKYIREVTGAAEQLYRQRLLLKEDVQRYLQEAIASTIGRDF